MTRCVKQGFTLIEIMIVIAIIAILAGIGIPNLLEARQEANLQACKQNILTIVKAMDATLIRHTLDRLYSMNNESSYIINILQEEGYINKIPTCPATGNEYTVYLFYVKIPKDGLTGQEKKLISGFNVACAGSNGHYVNGNKVRPVFYEGCNGGRQLKSGWGSYTSY